MLLNTVRQSAHLLLRQLLLDLVAVAHAVDHRFGQLRLDARQPRTQVAHVLIELLHRHQCLLQLPHPANTQIDGLEADAGGWKQLKTVFGHRRGIFCFFPHFQLLIKDFIYTVVLFVRKRIKWWLKNLILRWDHKSKCHKFPRN